ncbi:MAG: hypothetical protein RSC08_04775, partial [Oscillospiraceae bacterium]
VPRKKTAVQKPKPPAEPVPEELPTQEIPAVPEELPVPEPPAAPQDDGDAPIVDAIAKAVAEALDAPPVPAEDSATPVPAEEPTPSPSADPPPSPEEESWLDRLRRRVLGKKE